MARACCLLPGSTRLPPGLQAPVMCRACMLGAYLHGAVARGERSSLLSVYAIFQQLPSITCLRARMEIQSKAWENL